MWGCTMASSTTRIDSATEVERPRLAAQCHSADQVQLSLSADLTEQLRELAKQQGVTLFVTLLSGWTVLIGHWTDQEEVVICTRLANRRSPEIEPSVGAFENTAVLRVRLQEDATIEQQLKQTRAAVAETCAHQAVEALKPVRNHSQVSQVLMGLNDTSATIIASTELQLSGPKPSEVSIENSKTRLELSLVLSEGEKGLAATLMYARGLFKRETIERMATCWRVLLEGMVTDVQQPINQLPLLTAAEREQLLDGFNDTAVVYPQDRLIHELFEEQVQRTPDAIAVVHEGECLTYAELNSRANQLARYLVSKEGVGPDQLVGICTDRSLEMVVGLLGILKAGGAYVPLDPAYPSERLAYMLRDATPSVLLIQERLRERLPNAAAEVIALDNDWNEIAKKITNNPDSRALGLRSDHLAYVIYTSGSTGQPKGVMIEHRNVVNLYGDRKSVV
mgnify:CR=1 FL=1